MSLPERIRRLDGRYVSMDDSSFRRLPPEMIDTVFIRADVVAGAAMGMVDQCCEAICGRCAAGDPWEMAAGTPSHWDGSGADLKYTRCDAAKIRELGQ